jgi:Ca-activated chloride channel family protein
VATSTFGVGSSFDDVLLAGMADAGGGKYHYIPNAAAIPAVFAGQLGELLAIGARNVYLSVLWPIDWSVANLNHLEEERTNHWLQVSLGDMMAGEQRTVAWRCELPAATSGDLASLELRLSWCDANGRPREVVPLSLEIEARSDPGGPDQEVLDEVALLVGARAREEAVRYARAGQRDLAQEVLARARGAMPASPAGLAEAGALDRIVANIDAADEDTRKEWYYESRLRQRNQRDYRRTNR